MIAGDRNAWCFPEMVKAINAATVNSKIYDFGEPNEVNGNIMIGTDKKLFAANKYLRVRTTNAESNTSGVLKVEVKTSDSLTSGGTALNNPEVIYSSRENFVERIMELTDGQGVDLAIDTSGNEICVQDNIKVLKKDGTMVFVGYSNSGMMNIPTGMICDKEINLKAVFRYRHIYPLAIKAVSEGLIDVESIVSNIFEFDDIYEKKEKSITDKENIVKSAIKIS